MEGGAGLEPATHSLTGCRSTDWANHPYFAGFSPARIPGGNAATHPSWPINRKEVIKMNHVVLAGRVELPPCRLSCDRSACWATPAFIFSFHYFFRPGLFKHPPACFPLPPTPPFQWLWRSEICATNCIYIYNINIYIWFIIIIYILYIRLNYLYIQIL